MLIRNILVAVDGSENSDRALDFALDIAEKFSSTLLILNVSEVIGDGRGSSRITYLFQMALQAFLQKIFLQSMSKF